MNYIVNVCCDKMYLNLNDKKDISIDTLKKTNSIMDIHICRDDKDVCRLIIIDYIDFLRNIVYHFEIENFIEFDDDYIESIRMCEKIEDLNELLNNNKKFTTIQKKDLSYKLFDIYINDQIIENITNIKKL